MRRGFSLLNVLIFSSLLLTLTLTLLGVVQMQLGRAAREKLHLQAETAARSGYDYAVAMHWKGPRDYVSPDLEGCRFHVTIDARGAIKSVGTAGAFSVAVP